MHILYVDESGDDGFLKDNEYRPGLTPTKYFIRTGLVIHDWKWFKINKKIDAFRKKRGIPKNVEIHATEIWNGKRKIHKNGKRKTIPNWYGHNFPDKNDRRKILIELCEIIKSLDIELICVAIDKTKIRTKGSYKDIPKDSSWEFLIERYNLVLRNAEDKKGIIISDASQTTLENKNREFAKAIYTTSLHVKEIHFIESILFEPSDSSNLLQMVDVASYAFQRKYNVNDEELYEIIESKLYQHSGKIDGYGLKIWPEQ